MHHRRCAAPAGNFVECIWCAGAVRLCGGTMAHPWTAPAAVGGSQHTSDACDKVFGVQMRRWMGC